jgi:hypothetical protein
LKPRDFTPNELKAFWYHYGDARTAAKKLGIGTGTLIENATSDFRGTGRKLSEKSKASISKAYYRQSDKTRRSIQKLAKNLGKYPDAQLQKRILKTPPKERKKLFKNFDENVQALPTVKGIGYKVFGHWGSPK